MVTVTPCGYPTMMADATRVPDHLRFWWFEDGELHFDAPRYARLRRITVDEALIELRELAAKVLPTAPIREK
jgi:hypothetical protein